MNSTIESEEATIVRKIDQLTSKLVGGIATVDDRTELNELLELRSKLLHPPVSAWYEDRRRRFG